MFENHSSSAMKWQTVVKVEVMEWGGEGGGAASAEEQCDKVPSQSAESTQRISTPLAMTSVQMLRLELYAGVFNDLPAEKIKKNVTALGCAKCRRE